MLEKNAQTKFPLNSRGAQRCPEAHDEEPVQKQKSPIEFGRQVPFASNVPPLQALQVSEPAYSTGVGRGLNSDFIDAQVCISVPPLRSG